jgi:phage tail sheath protein FI
MTAEDLLNGKMKIQVSISPVHPAEFLILNFEVDMIK